MEKTSEIRQIAWVKYNGGMYGTAHSHDGAPLGNVFIEKKAGNYEIVVYEFKGSWGVVKSGADLGLEKAKRTASSKLKKLLEAA